MKKFYSIILFCTFGLTISSQEDIFTFPNKSAYIETSAGFSTGKIRDRLTTPLFYNLTAARINLSKAILRPKGIYNYGINYYGGMYNLSTNDDFFVSTTQQIIINFNYTRLLEKFSSVSYRYYSGGCFQNHSLIWLNEAFGNAAFTFSNISNLNFDFKYKLLFIKPSKEKKLFWLIKYKTKERKYMMDFDLSIPVISSIYRPEFTNPGNSTLNNSMIFNGYKMNLELFTGLQTDFSLNEILSNGNMFRYGYRWQMGSYLKQKPSALDVSYHSLYFSLIFKSK
ncbi:MAG: hypothetical protein WHW07_08005 [Bacteroidales bacterium]|jgi:hypothetical protein|nr:hypothetical protein [Bacteroidales bacterium]HOL97148.1 hypothetical protein [Bacteroidales bacterium]HOM35441.1 hypothetical protein [Bacteroidales bacterium]HPD23068.1 hypothetical protein [Bacteroidales bacterium]HRS99356.1 hypothetical protein [Bacteroidales bacterium]